MSPVAHVGIGSDAELGCQLVRRILPRPEPRPADVERGAVLVALSPHASADAIARLEHGDAYAGLRQAPRGREPGVARADDANVSVDAIQINLTQSCPGV